MKKQLYYTFIIIWVFNSFNFYSQSSPIYWLHSQSGLPTTFVRDIDQDEEGNMLFATYLGLIVYDGKNFSGKTIKDSLPTTSVYNIEKDEYRNIWIKTHAGQICQYQNGIISPINEYNKNRFNRITYNFKPISKNEFFVDYVLPFYSVKYQRTNNTWKTSIISDSLDNRIPLRDPINKNICAYFDYKRYAATKEIEIKFKNGKQINILSEKFEKTISKLSIENHEYLSFDNILVEYNKEGIVKRKNFESTIVQILKGENNTLWITFKAGGVLHIKQNTFEPTEDIFLKDQTIYAFFEDIDGGRWFSTDEGLGYLPNNQFIKYELKKDILSTINDGIAIHDTIILGHSNGDVGYIIPSQNKPEKLLFTHAKVDNPYFEHFVSDFAVGPNNNIIFSNVNTGIYEINRKTLRVNKLAEYGCSGVFVHENKIYCALYEKGVLVIEGDKQTLLNISDATGKVISVEYAFINSSNELMLGCENGLKKYSKDSIISVNNKKELNDRIVYYSKITNELSVIFTCGSGVILCSKNDTIVIDKNNNLGSICPGSICKDSEGNIWITGAEGVSKIRINNNNIHDYTIETILGEELRNYTNFAVVSNGNNVYLLSKYIILNLTPNGLTRSYSKLPFIISARKNTESFNISNHIEYLYDQNAVLNISFKQINYLPDTYVSYYYRLVGYNDAWLSTANNNISYNNLPPGNYKLEAYAEFSYNKHKSTLKTINIIIEPTIYQRLWFKIALVFILSTILFLIVFYLTKRKIRKIKNESELKLRISAMENKLLRSNMNPHFVFNSLNSIQSYISREEKDNATFYLGRFSKLMRNILDQTYYENISLEDELEMIKIYVELEQMRCNFSFEFKIVIDELINVTSTKIPSMLIQPYIENAIIHGLGPLKERKGLLTLKIKNHHSKILNCIIEDNGIGRVSARKIQMQRETFHKSMGLSITSERLEYFKSQGNLDAKVNIIDLYNEDGTATGTRVEISIPIN